ncbi:TonB C-terminal domain-containing protein [Pseudomonas sp. GX19020]|uniref:energy transducer TonB family protein n=1 Tax=Pseudomonas sp. GX19020 TaxID=2942277 RepID=UPI0020191F68|nr:energy transducer TonB [Pseudomonas sp. GX19020]MCL4066571.1 TonB C-terminal domain-containing protein [Pseudomonas sp. GX19020]
MTQELPSFTRARCPVLPSHVGAGKSRAMGWLASTSIAALLVSAIGALAMTWDSAGMSAGAEEQAVLVMLPPAQAIEAISEPTPDVTDQMASEEMLTPDLEDAPDTPELTEAPDVPDETPEIQEIVEDMAPEVDQEPPPKPVVEVPKPKERPKKEEKPKEVKKAEKPKEPAKEKPKKRATEERAETKASKQQASAASSAGSGQAAAKNYGASVMKKVNRTRKKSGGDRGTAVVSFTIADNGSLAKASISRSSGSAKLDDVALDHIRRSAPFDPPPAGAGRTYSFKFEGR